MSLRERSGSGSAVPCPPPGSRERADLSPRLRGEVKQKSREPHADAALGLLGAHLEARPFVHVLHQESRGLGDAGLMVKG